MKNIHLVIAVLIITLGGLLYKPVKEQISLPPYLPKLSCKMNFPETQSTLTIGDIIYTREVVRGKEYVFPLRTCIGY
jgi:hypothetical protein